MIILSFFKGALDLLEGIFVDMGLDVARYDGDLNQSERSKQLDHFKTKDSCRVLLATVHVLGTGLNIIQANHVFFVDRWFNPTVHDQAQDRYDDGKKFQFLDVISNPRQFCFVWLTKTTMNPSAIFYRTYRIGQEKPVFVSFFDNSGTIGMSTCVVFHACVAAVCVFGCRCCCLRWSISHTIAVSFPSQFSELPKNNSTPRKMSP